MTNADFTAGSLGSFKFGYSRGLPSYMAPKLLTNKKTAEYFVASLYAQFLFYDKIPIIGVEVCEDDSNKGPDAVIKILNSKSQSIQITRFTITEYLKRRKISEQKVGKLVDRILKLIAIESPVNVIIHSHKPFKIPINSQKIEATLSNFIAKSILDNKATLLSSKEYIYCPVTDERLLSFTPMVCLQSVPKDCHSNFFGRGNIFIDFDFDNVHFSNSDIEKECLDIYIKKNGGKASILLIWADTFEILYDPKNIIEKLKAQFDHSSFEKVFFLNFYNRLDLYVNQEIGIAQIK